jgi:isopenicillin N synthase-like dioxygenase
MWPSKEDQMFCEGIFHSYDALARRLLSFIHPKLVPSYLETYPLDAGEISDSFLHLFQYGVKSSSNSLLPCAAHTDSGLLTLIPRAAGAPGLEVLDMTSKRWIKVEELFEQEEHAVCVLIGETLAGLLGVQATVHRVVRTEEKDTERISIPFQLRADPRLISKFDPQSLERRRTQRAAGFFFFFLFFFVPGD